MKAFHLSVQEKLSKFKLKDTYSCQEELEPGNEPTVWPVLPWRPHKWCGLTLAHICEPLNACGGFDVIATATLSPGNFITSVVITKYTKAWKVCTKIDNFAFPFNIVLFDSDFHD
jgi:hypothetical protein